MATVTRATFPECNVSAVLDTSEGRSEVALNSIQLVSLVVVRLRLWLSRLAIRVLALEPRGEKVSSINEKMWEAMHIRDLH